MTPEEHANLCSRLIDLVREHLDSFVVVGYSLNGERVQALSYINEMQEDALETLLQDVLSQHKAPDILKILTEEEGEDE